MQKAASVDTSRLGLFIPKGLGHCLIQKIVALYYTCMHFPLKDSVWFGILQAALYSCKDNL